MTELHNGTRHIHTYHKVYVMIEIFTTFNQVNHVTNRKHDESERDAIKTIKTSKSEDEYYLFSLMSFHLFTPLLTHYQR